MIQNGVNQNNSTVNPSSATTFAQVAGSSFMANSNNAFLRGMGQYGMARHMIQNGMNSNNERGFGFIETTVTTSAKQVSSNVSSEISGQNYAQYIESQIESLDSDTAAVEAQIRELEMMKAKNSYSANQPKSRKLADNSMNTDEFV